MQMLYQRLQPLDPLSRKTSFHNATACTDCNSQQEQRCDLPWTLQRSRPWGHWQNWVRPLAPWWWGVTIDSSPTALCWARPHTVLGTSALLGARHTSILCSFVQIFTCGLVLFWFGLVVVWVFFPQQFYFCYSSMNQALNRGKNCSK